MMYPFMTLDDNTEVVHSEMLPDGRVKVYFEKPDAKDCFHSAVCYLPDYKWTHQRLYPGGNCPVSGACGIYGSSDSAVLQRGRGRKCRRFLR